MTMPHERSRAIVQARSFWRSFHGMLLKAKKFGEPRYTVSGTTQA